MKVRKYAHIPGKADKLRQRYSGPHKVMRQMSDNVYELELISNSRSKTDAVNVDRIEPFFDQPSGFIRGKSPLANATRRAAVRKVMVHVKAQMLPCRRQGYQSPQGK